MAAGPALLEDLELLDVLEHLVIIPGELVAPEGLLQRQNSPLQLGGDNRAKLDRPHIRLALVGAHALEDHANDVTQVLVGQVEKARQPLQQLRMVLVPQRDLLLLDEEGCQDDYQALQDHGPTQGLASECVSVYLVELE